MSLSEPGPMLVVASAQPYFYFLKLILFSVFYFAVVSIPLPAADSQQHSAASSLQSAVSSHQHSVASQESAASRQSAFRSLPKAQVAMPAGDQRYAEAS